MYMCIKECCQISCILFAINFKTDKKCPFCSPSLHFPTKNVLMSMDGIFMIRRKNFKDRYLDKNKHELCSIHLTKQFVSLLLLTDHFNVHVFIINFLNFFVTFQNVPNDCWQITRINEKYDFCETYPGLVCHYDSQIIILNCQYLLCRGDILWTELQIIGSSEKLI